MTSSQDRQVLQIANRVSAKIGTEFFSSVTEHLAEVLRADCVYIGEFLGGQTERVRTLSAYLDHRPDRLDYELAGSAAAQLALGKPCLCRARAQARFPADPVFTRLGAEACVGVALENGAGVPIGVLMAIYREPIPGTNAPQTILEIFAPRAAAELERRQHEEQLQQSEQRHRAFIALNTDAMGRIEFEQPISTALPEEEQLDRIYQDGYVAECNDALARQLGFERAEELIGCRLNELAPLSNSSVRDATLHAIRSGYRFNMVEVAPVGPDGSRMYVLRSQWGIVEDGMLRRIWGSTRDITALKRSKMELDAAEQRISNLLESLPLMIVILRPEGEITFCNRHLFRLTGWRQSEVAGKDWVDLMMPEEERGRVRAALESARKGAGLPIHFETPILGPEGKRRWMAWDSTSLRDSEGRPVATVNVGRDLTDYRALEAKFHQAQKLESIGRLAGGLADDFNNLLTIIMGHCRVLLEKGGASDDMHTGLSEIQRVADKGAGLTQQLLAFSRRRDLRPEVLNLTEMVDDEVRTIRQLIGEPIDLVTDLDPSLGLVAADAGHIHQIILNLVLNARDAMPEGGTLTIRTSNIEIVAGAPGASEVEPGAYVQLRVTDTGGGMTEEVRSHLFEPFYTTKARGEGTGLGLSTVYGIVRQSGGHIVVETEPGKGTTLGILLPRV